MYAQWKQILVCSLSPWCFHLFNPPPTHLPSTWQASTASSFLFLFKLSLVPPSTACSSNCTVQWVKQACSILCSLCPMYTGHCNGIGFLSWIVDGAVCEEGGHTWRGTQERKSTIKSDDSFSEIPHWGVGASAWENHRRLLGSSQVITSRLTQGWCGLAVGSYSSSLSLRPSFSFCPPLASNMHGVDWILPRGLIKSDFFSKQFLAEVEEKCGRNAKTVETKVRPLYWYALLIRFGQKQLWSFSQYCNII